MTVLDASSLTVRYGAREALRDVTFRYGGGALGLLGPNGAGKSSLLRATLGLIRPFAGRVEVLGMDAARRGVEVRARSGYVPENDCHVPGLTGVEFVTFCGRLCGLDRRDARRRAHEVLVYAGLEEERYRKVDEYSRGMKQKVKLAAALVHDPAVLFLDEPTNGLDPQGRQDILELIRDLAHDKGMNVVLSSHLLKDVEAVCDELVVLDQGRVCAAGRIEELKSRGGGFEVRTEGPPERFSAAAEARGLHVTRDSRGRLHVAPRDGASLRPRDLFRLARESNTRLTHLIPLEESLEDLFLRALSNGDGQKGEG